MIRGRRHLMRWRLTDADDAEEIGSTAHDRLMLLQLASELERWPARNIVYRNALGGVAREIVQLAQGELTGRS